MCPSQVRSFRLLDQHTSSEQSLAELTNLLRDIPASLPDELVETLVAAAGIRIERIISRGHSSPPDFWYDPPESEWVLVVAGSARLTIEGEQPITLLPGSFLNIPAHQRHRVEWTDPSQPTVWLAVHYGDSTNR